MTSTDSLTVWQALAVLGGMTEARARMALRQIGMKYHEMDQPYPEESMGELGRLLLHPEELDAAVKEASEWQISRN